MAAIEAHIHRKKASLLSLEPLLGKTVEILCLEHRVLLGTLTGFDSNMNLVLANASEELRDFENHSVPRLDSAGRVMTRSLGPIIVRGGCVLSVLPISGKTVIDNPFI